MTRGHPLEQDLRQLDEYRRCFGDAYQEVVQRLRHLGELPTGRPAKSTPSIVEKLRRESILLSQMQDIAGCMVVVDDTRAQRALVSKILREFSDATTVDRTEDPSHGYRAFHIIVRVHGSPIEIQVRTSLQHLWA